MNMVNILLSLDLTEEVLDKAIKNGANVILTHHSTLFSPLKQITKENKPLLFKALTYKINLLAMYTNFDLAEKGLNDYVGNLLGIKKIAPLQRSPEKVFKFAVYVPIQSAGKVRQAIFEAGAGKIGNYTKTSFNITGQGTFKPMEGTNPFIGKIGEKETVSEIKIETVVSERNLESAVQAMKSAHPYEEPAYDIYEILNKPSYGICLWGKIDNELGLNVLKLEHFDTEKFFVEAIYSQLVKLGISKALLVKSKKMELPYQLL